MAAPCVSHDHDCDQAACAGNSLFKVINHSAVTCLNAVDPESAKAVLRPWEQRRSREPCLESNAGDPELLIHVPFTTDVKVSTCCRRLSWSLLPHAPLSQLGLQLTGITVAGAVGESPTRLKVWINRDDIDFTLASELPALQDFALVEDLTASMEYQTRASKFQCVSSLTLHLSGDGDALRISFVGLRGQADPRSSRDALATVVYEAVGMPQDHKVPDDERAMAQRLGH